MTRFVAFLRGVRPMNAKRPRRRRGRVVVLALALGGAAATVTSFDAAHAGPFDLPPIDPIVHYQPKLPLQVFTSDGVDIGQFGAERRIYAPLAQTPKLLQQAVLAVEDARFREHSGIDPKGMARALFALVTGGMKQGASTITQQLVRTMLLTQRFTAERKAKEIALALKVEQAISKDRILEIYLNEIFLGQRAYGFAAAAQTYFGKPLDQLTLAETAMLAGLPQNPHYANPIANLERATARQAIVLERMRATGVITDAQAQAAKAERLALRAPWKQDVHAAHVAEMARRAVVERFGTEAYVQGIKVYTSLRAAEQQAAHQAVRRGVLALDRRGPWRGPEAHEDLPSGATGAELERAAAQALKDNRDDETLRVAIVLAASPKAVQAQLASGERVTLTGDSLRWAAAGLSPKAKAPMKLDRGAVIRVTPQGSGWTLAQWPQVESALVALDPVTGRVRALVGGFDFTRQPFNHVTQGLRQSGSAFKPFVYAAALERGIQPATLVDDAPFVGANGWSPQNYDGTFAGPITLREALAKSKNTVSVRLAQHVGPSALRDWVARFGLDAARQPDNLTIGLGTGSVTPLQLAQGYAVFANGGWKVTPVLIEKITDAQGKVLFQAPAPPVPTESTRAIPERDAFVTASLLNDVTRVGTAAKAQTALRRNDLYGKTGTTSDAFDAWFAGWQPQLVSVVWVGYDEPKSLGERETGGGLALPIWIDFMAQALKTVPVAVSPLAPPVGVVRAGPGNDWMYAEWTQGGWVQQLVGQGEAVLAPPLATTEPASAPLSGDAPPASEGRAPSTAVPPPVAAPSAGAPPATVPMRPVPQGSSAPPRPAVAPSAPRAAPTAPAPKSPTRPPVPLDLPAWL